MRYTKKLSLFLITIIIASTLFAKPADNVYEYTLENGMQVFLLEDSTDALVHIEYTCHAGFSSQTQNNCGFFKLYSRLFRNITNSLNYTDIQCNADSTRYILSVSPAETEQTLETLSQAAFSPIFTDELLNKELTKLKNEVSDNAETMATYINAAIDSRVFSDAPWKHDSGIYPPLFKKITQKNARTIIKDISDRWYIPNNSAIFISGNINPDKILVTLKNTFGRFYSNYNTPQEKPSIPINQQRKYVFHNSEISEELTQLVVQYTMLNMEQCDVLSQILNNNASTFKKNILEYDELNIPGGEYIDVSAAHKRNSSRMIIQTLMQPPENKKLGITSFQQTQQFLDIIQNIPNLIQAPEVQFAKDQLTFSMNYLTANPVLFMDNLSSFWAGKNYYQINEEDTINYPNSITASMMMNRTNHLTQTNMDEIFQTLQSESPFVFVIINTKDYKPHQKEYKNAGFEEINENNSSWYVQTMFKEIKEQFSPTQMQSYKIEKVDNTNNYYYEKNIAQIKTTELSNGIKIISKQNTNSTDISLLLTIKGGKLNTAHDHGLEEVMTTLMSTIIQKEIYKLQMDGLILGNPIITPKTDISTSTILIEFEKEDTIPVCNAITNSLVYGEIAPADADRAVSSRQYRKRLENGSANSQMYSGLIKAIYGKGIIYSIFDTEKEILQTTDYHSILEAYPAILDANRYSIILTGNFDDDIFKLLGNSFEVLNNNNLEIASTDEKTNIPNNKSLTLKIRHTFLTDIPAEEAGPQPAVLIPTTEFLDPVIYVFESPAQGTKEAAIFNAILNYVEKEYQKQIDNNRRFNESTVSIQQPRSHLDFGTITVSNVNHIKEADVVYKNTINSILEKMNNPQANTKIIQDIKNNWIVSQMISSYTNTGTAQLIQKGFELFPDSPVPEFYLQEYNFIQSATVQDFIEVMKYFPTKPQLRVYSAEGKN